MNESKTSPNNRIAANFSFIVIGTDYAGLLSIKINNGRGYKIAKGYICIFICFATKAVHLEVVTTLSSDCFILALKIFTARGDKPSRIHSDNGTNFVGTNSKLDDLDKFIKQNHKLIRG